MPTKSTARPPSPALRRRAAAVVAELARLYPNAKCSLHHDSPFQLLVATILSAQCTDARVNLVTPALFQRFPTAHALAVARQPEVEELIQSTGFFRNKAKSLIGCAQALVERHGGEVPKTLAELVPLPGIGRKTANVVLGNAYGIASGMVVDTHIGRLARRLGLTKHTDAVKVERDLMKLIPPEEWTPLSHRLIYHGRAVCKAQRPACDRCTLAKLCPKVGIKKE